MPLTARHVKNLPGRKTDVADATWLAQLGAHGLVRGSFVPPEPIRRLRDLTRTRTSITRERSREVQRLERLLEDSGIKLSSVATDIMGVSSRSMIEALIRGDRDVVRMADLAQRRMRAKIPRLTEALVGRFTEHHAFLAQLHLNLIDQHTDVITQLIARIGEVMEPFRGFHDLVRTIPGIGPLTADVIVAETGGHVAVPHREAPRLVGWHHAGEQRVRGTGEVQPHPPRNPYLQGALGVAAMSIARAPSTYLNARYRRIAMRRGPHKANVAIQHALLLTIRTMATTGAAYDDPGADYYTRRRPEQAKQRAIHQLEAMGYRVSLDKAS